MPNVNSKDDLRHTLQAYAAQIAALGVQRLGIFGSFARDTAGPESDVDLFVEFASGAKTFDAFMQLAFLLEEVLGRPVELITPESLSPYLGPRILEEVEDVPLHA